MNKLPLVAVVGRPNVGKSTFFNKVCGKRISIVKDIAGVTRDRIYQNAEWCGYNFTLVDTGGIELKSDDAMYNHIYRQAEIAIDLADVILFFADGKEGVTANDVDIAHMLRKTKKPVILAVNKLDNFELDKLYEFYELNLGEPQPVSCEQSKGLGDLLDLVVANFSERTEDSDDGAVKIAVVGKPNVGKSSLVNRLLGFDRVIVSDVAGTTRDAIDTPFEYEGSQFTLIDTAGLRRKRGIDSDTVESYSVMRTLGAIRRADIVFVVFDGSDEISEQDIRIAGLVHEQGKPSVIVVNKWDKVEKDTFTAEKVKTELNEKLNFMDYYRMILVSAETGQRALKIMELAKEVYVNSSRRITTGILNEVVNEAVAMNEPPAPSGRRLKIMYSTQVDINPPKFVIFVNKPELVHFSYKRYLENSLRKAFDFGGTPINIVFSARSDDKN